MNIDLSKFILKCDIDDCEENEEHVCCVSCDSFQECIQKEWTCVHLDDDNSPEGCSELYLKKSV